MRGVEEIADELYRLPPAEFTAARDAEIAQARARGDRTTATALAALKRPTLGAWLVNLLALRRPDLVGEILELGDQIRQVQAGGAAVQLRDLSAHRRRLLDAAVGASRSIATSAGAVEPTTAQLADAEATLSAAMADEEAARLVRSGRVVKALSYAGFGGGFGASVPVRSGASRTSGGPAGTRPVQQPPSQAQAQRPSAQRSAAEQRLARAEAALTDARTAEAAAADESARLVDQIAMLRESLDQVQVRARAARQERLTAQRELESAQRRLARLSEGPT